MMKRCRGLNELAVEPVVFGGFEYEVLLDQLVPVLAVDQQVVADRQQFDELERVRRLHLHIPH